MALSTIGTSGRKAAPLRLEIDRALTEADLGLLEAERGIKPSLIKRLRDSHHAVARFIARGLSNVEISALTGYSQGRISTFKSDPAGQELIAYYRKHLSDLMDGVDADGYARAVAIRDTASEIVLDRLLDEFETIPLDQAAEIALKFGDRTGIIPASKSSSTNLTINLADQVAAGRQRIAKLSVVETARLPAATATTEAGEGSPLPSPAEAAK
jgi:hypothetical protein